MKKAVIYARYSSDRQTEQSIEGQLRVCHEFAEKNDIAIIDEYIDRALSGTTDKRPAFQKMISDSSSQHFDYVIVYKLDRFARNRFDSAIYKSKLKQNGVRVLSAMEGITDTPEGIIMEGIIEAMNEYYSAELSQKIKRGMRENVIKGKVTGGNVALGYKVGENKHLEIDESQAVTVRKIFDAYASGKTYAEIIKELNEQGLKTSRGNAFNKSSLTRILTNERYIGKYTIEGVTEQSDCPRIISDELFYNVQEKVKESQQKNRKRSSHIYILSGLLYCEKCGCKMTSTGGTSKTSKRYHYYYCPNKCTGRVKAEYLENTVLDMLHEYLTGDNLDVIANAAYKEYKKNIADDSELKEAKKQLQKVEKSIQNGIDAILNGFANDTLKHTLENLESQKENLQAKIEDLSMAVPKLTIEHFKVVIRRLVDDCAKNLVDVIVSKITYSPERVVVYINITNPDNTPPLDKIEFNVSSPPPNQTLNAIIRNGFICLCKKL